MKRRDGLPEPASPSTESLKYIVEHMHNPEQLDDYPFARSRVVAEAVRKQPALGRLPPGRRLLGAIAEAFVEMMPSLPPRRGLRLDTQWGEFGILAARYFAPLKFGVTTPTSLRDAWGRIDESILLFVYGREDASLSPADRACYRLVGNEPEVTPDSTLSDWHRNGLKRLARMLSEREAHLSTAAGLKAKSGGARGASKKRGQMIGNAAIGLIIGLALLAAVLLGLKAYRIYRLAYNVWADLRDVKGILSSSLDSEGLARAAGQLPRVDADITALQVAMEPIQWITPMLRWVPVYGGDIAQSRDLLELGHQLIGCAEKAQAGLTPVLVAASGKANVSLPSLVQILAEARPQLIDAEASFRAAQEVRGRIDAAQLSPPVKALLTEDLDAGMAWMGDGLTLGIAFPAMMGEGPGGPQTYLVLAQNEDELRPTGGYITSVGKLVLDRGHVVDLSFENAGDLDDWSMPYPMAPWQLNRYMNSSVLVLRDANWFPDFPTVSLYVRQMYAYNHQNSVDGVIAFDQQMLTLLLEKLGPVNVEGVPYAITADNVTEYMRQAKRPPTNQPLPTGWTYKGFVGKLARAVLDKILAGEAPEWRSLATVLLQGLQERHLLLQIDDRDFGPLVVRRGWSGAISSDGGDFLMVLDSNLGFNKTNAVVDTNITYDIDLENLAAPTGTLLVSHTNRAAGNPPCVQWDEKTPADADYYYPIDRCYWDYMRIYVPAGTRLLDATPQTIPDAWMILNQHVPAQVDALDEGLPGLSSFGTLLVVPGGGTVNSGFHFALPASVVLESGTDGSLSYMLTIRKQPGTSAVPITVRVHLPANAIMAAAPGSSIVSGGNVLIEANLKVDQSLAVTFRLP